MPQCNQAEPQPVVTLVCSSTSMLKFSFFTVRSVSFMVQTQMCLYLFPVKPQPRPADLMGAEGRCSSPETNYIIGHKLPPCAEHGSSLTDRGSVSKVRHQTLRYRSATML